MKKFAFVLAFCSASLFAGEWSGTVSDAKCGAAHADASEKSMKCVNGCVKGGQAAVLVVDGKVYKIENKDAVADHLGHKVTVNGELSGDTITVKSVKAQS